MSDGNERDALAFHQREQQQRDDWTRADRIEDLIQRCSRAIGRGEREHYRWVAVKLRDELIPLIARHTEKSFSDYDRELGTHPSWDWVALTAFLDAPDAYVNRLTKTGSGGLRSLGMQLQGLADEDTAARLTVQKTLASLTAIAERLDIVMEEYSSRVAVQGLSLKLGDHLQDEDLNLGEPIYGVSMQSGGIWTLHGGPPGSAKSAGLEREAEDVYCYDPDDPPELEHLPDKPFKLIDLVDLEKGESWFYDIPQQQEVLREIREEHDLPPAFDPEEEDRQVEILAPLTPGLQHGDLEGLPYDVERDEWTVRPFVIPASDVPKSLLVSTIMTRLSNSQEQTVRQAYDEVDRAREDWSLKHLAEEIRVREELSEKHKADAIGVLRSLQDEGFIRTGGHDHQIDWRAIFEDTDTVTVFTQAKAICETQVGQLFVVAYLLDKILRLRSGEGMYGLPPAYLIARELWEIVPHKQRDLPDERASAIQEFIGDTMGRALRKGRHYDLLVGSDTQKPFDLKNSVREMFNRYVIYSGTSKLVDGVMDWTGNEKSKSFRRTLTAKRGQAGIVGEVQPAIDRRWVEYLSPVEYVPPSHHHWDKDRDRTGWLARVKYLEHEELRSPPWDVSIPEHLQIEAHSREETEDDEDEEIPPKELHRAEARNRYQRGESYRTVAGNIPNNPETGKRYSHTTIRDWVEDLEKGSKLDDDE